MAGRFVGFNDLVVGRRYRIVEPSPLPYVIPTISTGVIRSFDIATQESKNYVREYYPSSNIMGMITIETNDGFKAIAAKPETIYEELDAVGGRRSRKSRRSHRKSRKSIRKRVLHMS